MPTFESIGLHPQLRSRLVTQAATATSNVDLPPTAPIRAPRPPSTYQIVDTPLALLARHPGSLRVLDSATQSCQVIAPKQVTQLRREVAHALIDHTANGRRVRFVQEVLVQQSEDANNQQPQVPQKSGLKRKRQNDENALQSKAAAENCNDLVEEASETSAATMDLDARPCGMSPSTLSALQMIRCEAWMTTLHNPACSESRLLGIPTGCQSLDTLLAMPPEYRQLLPSTIQRELPSHASDVSSCVLGVPFGYVTQFFGPPASGKTQLVWHLAASRQVKHCWILCRPTLVGSCAQRVSELSRGNRTIVDHIHVIPVSNAVQVVASLAHVEAELQQALELSSRGAALVASESTFDAAQCEPAPLSGGRSLLILDAASTVLASDASSSDLESALLYRVATTLKRLARHYQTAVVVTNGAVVARDSHQTRSWAALGRRWNRTAIDLDVRIEATLLPGGRRPDIAPTPAPLVIRRCTLVRHPARPMPDIDPTNAIGTAHFCLDPQRGIVEP